MAWLVCMSVGGYDVLVRGVYDSQVDAEAARKRGERVLLLDEEARRLLKRSSLAVGDRVYDLWIHRNR